ncbi:MAG TPA: SDR family NAD(P)-dependent oxidoreductase [Dehalococcoidia bacterium]|nr:SDR family NAD(P)-dependent oxidoreductase [Dehalococcoidia bacterium]
MNILVTGATGFIGSYLCREMVRRGNNVFALSHSGKTQKVQQLLQHKKFHLLNGDIVDADMMTAVIRDNHITDVFHLAAKLPDGSSLADLQAYFDTNTRGTFNTLEAACQNDVTRFVYASTMSVYSEPPQYLPVDESHLASPLTPYGITKLAGEHICNMFSERLSLVILRFGGVYGMYQNERDVMPVFIKQALHSQLITVYGNGEQSTDFVHVDDVISGTLLAWEKGEPGVYNLASGEETRIIDLAEKIRSIAGSKSEITLSNNNTDRPFRFVLDISKARQALGWSPRPLAEGLTEYIKEYKAEV